MDAYVQAGKWKIQYKYIVLGCILGLGCLVRLIALEQGPMGLHHDEAYSAYNAWAVMNYGVDSYGYTRPVYYTVWGSGMSVLYSYLTMPFIALAGICTWAIRIPQAILGCISLYVIYCLGKEIRNELTGIAFAGILAINPWHIQQSRFGLDANVAVPMLLFGMYYLCRYLNGKRKSIWGAVLFLGLTLYSYALTWILVPIILVFVLIFYHKRICFNKTLIGALFVLFMMALPLLLFLAVNMGILPEICTDFISIPKLPAIRTGEMELSLNKVKRRFLWMVAMLWAQHDDIWWISNEAVGSYYYFSTPFILLGMFNHVVMFVKHLFGKKELSLDFLLALWFGAAFIVGCNIDSAKYYKVNFIHIPIILYGVLGVICVWKWLKKNKYVPFVVISVYFAAFGYYLYSQMSFEVNYENYGHSLQSRMHWNQYEEAIDRAEELTDRDIGILSLNYANVMLYKKIPPQDYMEEVIYEGDAAFLTVKRIGRYRFDVEPNENTEDIVFVYPYRMEEIFIQKGYTTEHVTDCYGVAYKET